MGSKHFVTTKFCLVSGCPFPSVSRGLCGTHYTEQRTESKWKREGVRFELEYTHNPRPMGLETYRKKVRALTRDIPVPNKMRRALNAALIDAYARHLEESE